jgi:hypothetical protein
MSLRKPSTALKAMMEFDDTEAKKAFAEDPLPAEPDWGGRLLVAVGRRNAAMSLQPIFENEGIDRAIAFATHEVLDAVQFMQVGIWFVHDARLRAYAEFAEEFRDPAHPHRNKPE